MANEVNADGLVVHYGPRTTENVIPGEYEVDGLIWEHVVEFDYVSVNASVAGTVLGVTTADLALRGDIGPIPIGAHIVSAYLDVLVPFVGDTIEVDIVTSAKVADAGSPVGGLISAAGAAAGIVAGGAFTANLAQNSYVDAVATAAGALTAGKARLIVRFIKP